MGKGRLEEAFRQRFDRDLPDSVNENHSLLVVGSAIADSSRRIIEYLVNNYGVPLGAASFQYFKDNSGEFLARAFLIEPEVAPRPGESRRSTVTIDGLLG